MLDTEFGKKRSRNYEAKYGKNGEQLIEFLGSNPRFEDLVRADVFEQELTEDFEGIKTPN